MQAIARFEDVREAKSPLALLPAAEVERSRERREREAVGRVGPARPWCRAPCAISSPVPGYTSRTVATMRCGACPRRCISFCRGGITRRGSGRFYTVPNAGKMGRCKGSIDAAVMLAGASRPFSYPYIPAKFSFPITQQAFRRRRGNRSSCPFSNWGSGQAGRKPAFASGLITPQLNQSVLALPTLQ
jgi:hypothetical protein